MRKTKVRAGVIVLYFVIITLSCVKTTTFNQTEKITESARFLSPGTLSPLWQTPIEDFVIDSLTVLPGSRLLVGTMAIGKDRTVRNKEFLVLNSSDGSILWRIPRKQSLEYSYTLPVIDPVVLIEERSPKEVSYRVLDLENKIVKWEKNIKGGESSSTVSQNYLIVSSPLNEKTTEVSALDLASGKQSWTQSFNFSRQESPSVLTLPETDDILIYGGQLAVVSPKEGKILWVREDIDLAAGKAIPRFDKDSLYTCDRNGVVYRLKFSDGSTVWKKQASPIDITSILASGDRVFIMSQSQSGPGGTLICVETKNGAELWRYDVPDAIHSSLYEDDISICFTSGKSFLRLDKSKGSLLLKMALPFQRIEDGRLPERIRFLADSFVIANESNIASFTLKRISKLFEHFIEPIRQYAEVEKVIQMSQGILARGNGKAPSVATVPYLPPVSRTYLDSVVSYKESVFQRTQSVLSSPTSSRFERQLATQEKITAIDADIAATKRQIQAERMQATINLAISVVNLAATVYVAILEARTKAVDVGALEQANLQLRIANENYLKLFQGDYYVRPFRSMQKGSGVTLINMKTGKRSDVVASPIHYSLEYTGQSFAVDFENKRLYVSGIGLNPNFYRATKIAELGMVNIDYLPSVIAFELRLPE
jgi:outer membrane protein assembly factor BamB